MKFSNVTLITANFNNALLTRVMIMSLIKKNVFPNILIIDNSTTEFFNVNSIETKMGIHVINNQNYKLTKNW